MFPGVFLHTGEERVAPPHLPPWGTFLHRWCAPILASPHPPSGSETGPLGTDQTGLHPSDEPTAGGQSELRKEKGGGLLMERRTSTFLTHQTNGSGWRGGGGGFVTGVTFVLHRQVDSAGVTDEGEGLQGAVQVDFTGDDVDGRLAQSSAAGKASGPADGL